MHGVPYWRLSGFYFFYFAALGGFLPYWGLYLQDIGFSPREIGEIMAIMVGTKIIAPYLWGSLADRTGKGIEIIRIACFSAFVAFGGIFIESNYWWVAFVTIVFSFFWNAALPQFEAVTLTHLKDDTHRYSRIRIWGSIGFIVTALSLGAFIDYLNVSLLPILLIVLLAGIWLVSQSVPACSINDDQRYHHGSLFTVLSQPTVLAFLLVCMLIQASHGPYYVFYSIYLKENGYSGAETGQLWALGVIAEVILFLFVYYLLKRFSLRVIIIASVFLSILRWIMIAWGVRFIGILVAAQILHAASFGATHVAAIHLIHRYFDGPLQGRGQALYSSASFGMGGVVGSLYSGHLWESQGPTFLYGLAACISGVAFLISLRWIAK